MADLGYNYLFYQREFINANQDVYKIGWTTDITKRLRNYPKGGRYLLTRLTTDYQKVEDEIKRIFPLKYIQRRDYGTEYFEGDHHEMIDDMIEIIKKYNTYRKTIPKNNIPIKINKTLHHFCRESFRNDSNSLGIDTKILHDYYISYWLKNNSVDIAYYNYSEFVDKTSKIIGKPVKNVFLGQKWSDNVDINTVEIITDNKGNKMHGINHEDEWAKFIDCYLIKSDGSYVQWRDLRERFREWHDTRFNNKLKKRADKARDYFGKHLGGYDETHFGNANVKGFIGWKLINR